MAYTGRSSAKTGRLHSAMIRSRTAAFSVSNRLSRPIAHRGVEFVVRLHYYMFMKDAVIPQIRVETELRASLDAVLRPGETLTDFVEVAVRNAVEYRRVQTDFASRCDASLAEYQRTGVSIPAAQVIAKLESKLAKRRKQLGG